MTSRRTLAQAIVLALLATLVAAAVGPAAFADVKLSQPDVLSIRKIDSTNKAAVKVSLIYNGKRSDLESITVRENGAQVKTQPVVSLQSAGIHKATVFAIDTSRSMGQNGGVTQARDSIRSFVDQMDPGDAVGVVAFGSTVTVVTDLTTDRSKALDSLVNLTAPPGGRTALWGGVKRAASLFGELPRLQPNLVVVTDGFDDITKKQQSAARTAVTSSGAAVYTLAYNQANQVDGASLTSLVELAGGRTFRAPRTADLAKAFTTIRSSLENQYVVTYASNSTQGATDLEVTVAGIQDDKTFVPGSVAQGKSALSLPSPDHSIVPDALRGGLGRTLGLVAVFLAVAMMIYAVALLMMKDESALDNVLSPYTEGFQPEEEGAEGGLAQTAFLQRAVDFTEEMAERQGFLEKVEVKLEQADLPFRAAEAIFFWIAGVVVLDLLILVWKGLVFLPALVVLVVAPMAVLNFLAHRRQKKFNEQLPDMLQLLAGSLRAGYSLMQGVEAVSEEVTEPMGKELRRVITEARLGRELEESLDGVGERMGSPDFEWAVMAIRIQREVGGNLAELLDTVGETMIQRERMRREVAALTAEGKISAIVLGILPPAIGLVMYVMNKAYMHVLFTETIGKAMLIGGIVSALVGFAWMKKIIKIEI